MGVGTNVLEAFTNCYNADSTSIFGGIVAINAEVDLPTAQLLSNVFLEIIIAPSFSNEAFELLSKKKNIRLLLLENSTTKSKLIVSNVAGGLLVVFGGADQTAFNGQLLFDGLTQWAGLIALFAAAGGLGHADPGLRPHARRDRSASSQPGGAAAGAQRHP